jgi:hypothetical protein
MSQLYCEGSYYYDQVKLHLVSYLVCRIVGQSIPNFNQWQGFTPCIHLSESDYSSFNQVLSLFSPSMADKALAMIEQDTNDRIERLAARSAMQ